MKKDYIKLYVDNVVYRLPQKDREEVRKELNANIYDMLSDSPDLAEIKAVLESLGSPKTLAEKYRTNPRYLISPAVFDDYIKVLSIGVPVVALISAFVGFMTALIAVISSNVTEMSEIMSEVIGGFISSIFSGAFYSAVMITVGFVIYEHTDRAKEKQKPKSWDIEQLKDINLSNEKNSIPLTGSVASIVVTVCLSVFFMLLALNIIPGGMQFRHNDIAVYNFFSRDFLRHCLYIIPILAAAAIFTDVLKIKYRRWTKGILFSAIGVGIIYFASGVFLFTRPNMLSIEFVEFLRSLPVETSVTMDAVINGKIIAAVAIAIVTIISSISIAHTVYKLVKLNEDNV